MATKRRRFAAAEKVRILRRHFIEKTPVSDICDEFGIRPTLFYGWQKLLFENGAAAFHQDNRAEKRQLEKKVETVASLQSPSYGDPALTGSHLVKEADGLGSTFGLGVALHVQGDSALDVLLGADSIDGLLHLPMTAVAALHGVGGGRQERIVQERQRSLEVGGEELREGLADRLEAPNALAQCGELSQRGVGAAATVEETIDLVHDLAQGAKVALACADPGQRALLGLGEAMFHKEMAMAKQVGDFRLESFLAPGRALLCVCGRATATELGQAGLQRLAHLRYGAQHGFGEFRDDVEFTDLVGDGTEDLQNRGGIEWGAVCRDPLHGEAAGPQGLLESPEEAEDVLVCGIMVQHVIHQTFEDPVVHDRKHAEGAIVEFVGGDIPGEVRQGLIEVVRRDVRLRLFFPPPPPSSAPWRRGRTPGDRATDARTPPGTAGHLRRPAGPPEPRPGACSGISPERGRPCGR